MPEVLNRLARLQSCTDLHVLRYKRVKNSGHRRMKAIRCLGDYVVSSDHVDDFFAIDNDHAGVGQ